MAGTATTEDLITLQQKQHQELTGTLDNITKNVKQLFKDVAGIVKDDGKSIADSIKKFEDSHKKQREKNNQLRITELKDLHKKMRGVEQEIQKSRIEKNKEQLTTSLKLQQDYNKKIKQLELFEMGYRLQKNKEFYKEINKTFKEFSDRTTKVAGKLDSVFSTTFFGSIAKATNSIAGMGKNLLNFGLGTMKFLQTVTSKEKGGGLKMALAQTKIGRGVRDVKRSFRQTKIGIGKGIKAIKSNMGGASGRMSVKAKAAEMQEKQNERLGISKKGAKASEGMFSSFTAFFKWFKAQWLFKMVLQMAHWAWQKAQGFLNFLKGGRGEAGKKGIVRKAAQVGRIGLKKFFRTGAGKFLGGTKGGLPTKLLKSGLGIAGAIGGIKGLIKGIGEFGKVAKEVGGGATGAAMGAANVGKNVASGILSGFTMGLVSQKSINKVIDSATNLVGKLTDKLLPSQKDYDKISQYKTGLSKRAIQTGKEIESIMEKTGVKSTSSSVLKQIMEDKEKWNKLTKEEQELVSKRVEGAKKRQSQKDKTPQVYAAEGFPKKTTQPKRLEDLFGKIDRRTNVTVAEGGEAEYLSVLKKEQYDQLKSMMMQQLTPGFLNPKSLIKGVGKAASATFKALGGAAKWLFGKKSDEEKKNQDEDIKKYGGEISKGAYKLKDQSVDVENLPFKNRLAAMLAERFKLTGKKTQVNSGYRSMEEQMRVYREMPDRAAKPGRSPHGPPNPRAVDMNSSDIADLVELGLIRKYGFKYPSARTSSGATETWHVQAKEGAAFANAPKDFLMKGHAGEGVFAAKTKEFESVFKYFEMGKQLAENVMSGKLGMNFSKDIPGRALRDTQKGPDTVENKLAQQTVKLLSEIKVGLAKDKMGKEGKEQSADTKIPQPTSPAQGGSAGYKPKSEVFPTDILMTNMYAMMTQFSGGY